MNAGTRKVLTSNLPTSRSVSAGLLSLAVASSYTTTTAAKRQFEAHGITGIPKRSGRALKTNILLAVDHCSTIIVC